MSQNLLDITVQTSLAQLGAIDTPQVLYMLAELRPPKKQVAAQVSQPLNLALVIDRSTSMKGERLARVKTAANLVIEKLAAGDTVSLITYSDRAEVVVPATPLTNRLPLQAKIMGIQASGGTEIYQGLAAGMKEMSKVALDQHISHLILLTDGHTYGDGEQCLELARTAAGRGIGFSAFGIGSEWNDQFLDELVAPSGGQSGFIAEPEQILHFLRQRIKGLGAVYAQNVRLSAKLPESVEIKEAFKLAPFAQPLTFANRELALGAVEGRAPLSILLELTIHPVPAGRTLAIPLQFKANIAGQEKEEVTVNSMQQFAVVSKPRDRKMPEALVKAVQIFNMYRMNEKIFHDVEGGNIDAATKRMESLTQRFREAGFTQLAQHASAETQRLLQTGALSLEGHKQLKYGTRTLLTSSLGVGLDAAEGGANNA
ncbi:MAG: VWA domain-containing protein [Chloroflexi bacterium]|nr:VWA domain-containing protein [Chloroflexota bacterium]MDA0245689.1 VWA domain-containing protein [Chloroflexota bacterium]